MAFITRRRDNTEGTPTGPAGGDLSGSYPNPEVVDDSHEHSSATISDYPHYKVPFDHSSAPSLLLRPMKAGESIREVVIRIDAAFDSAVSLAIGFPSNTGEIAAPNRIVAHVAGMIYKFNPYRISAIDESLTLYFGGSSPTKGNGIVFINLYDKDNP